MTDLAEAPHDLSFSRILDAPRDIVWACWTDPALMKHWFVPAPHSLEEAEVDARPGGIYRTVMKVDGNTHDSAGVVLQAEPARLLVFTDAFSPGWIMNPSPFMTAIIRFSDAPEGGTRYDVTVRHAGQEARDQHEKMGFFSGWGTAADQLVAHAASLRGERPEHELVTNRLLAAPPEAVWRAWTDPALLPKWWGPHGFHCETESMDLREGGHWRFTMKGEGQSFPNLHEYTQVTPKSRIAYRLSGFDDMRHHADVTVDFTPEAGGTRVKMRMAFVDMTAREALEFGALDKGYETLAKLENVARTLL